ncbi:alpha/beta fold hydrolase [Agromyces sp. ZXT2-6]|uniref:alpha/beta fold hydrolase n=1 Tax=Agromyces sp. ZXT2-6 TaxID=3461153 RepID=UPI004054B829
MGTTRTAAGRQPVPIASRLAASASLVVLLLAACTPPNDDPQTLPDAAAPTSTAPPAASGAFEPGAGDRSGLVDLGAGRSIHLECGGTGSPTVVLISGAGVAGDNWRYAVAGPEDSVESAEPVDTAVFPETASFTRVCAYDRPGTRTWDGTAARSTAVPQPTTTQAAAADLHAVLATAQIPGPYVIVGHSLGGLIATTFVRTHPEEVSGVVLVDPASPYMQATLPPDVWSDWMRSVAETGAEHPELETPDYPSSLSVLETTPPLPPMPAAVLSADRPFDYLGIGDAEAYWPQWLEAHALLAASLGARHLTETSSGHFVGNESPALVIEQICTVVAPPGGC